jgi:hypothetical protein
VNLVSILLILSHQYLIIQKHKDNDGDSGIGPIAPGVPAAQFNGNDNDTANSGYNKGNIKKLIHQCHYFVLVVVMAKP